MGMLKHFKLSLLAGFALTVLVLAQDQTGFISLDCGLPENSSYSDPTTYIQYISDATFIDSGIINSISPAYKTTGLDQPLWNVRTFPQGERNCYNIRVTGGVRYLIRGTFMYGNYDAKAQLPGFDLHLGANMWDSVGFKLPSDVIYKEIMHVPELNHIYVCLVNTGSGTPFISALELRPLRNDIYVPQSGSLALLVRLDTGAITDQTIRFKDDIFDRIWSPFSFSEWTPLSTSLTSNFVQNYFEPPAVVMSTAATPTDVNSSMDFYWAVPANDTSGYYIYMHFAEVQQLQGLQYRAFNISLNGNYWYGPFVPDLRIRTVYNQFPLTGGQYNFSLKRTENSTLPPIINAIEVYKVKELLQSETDQEDVNAIINTKLMYGVTRNWQGDPCAPQAYVWDGLQCSSDGYSPPRIVSLNLSSSGLTGEIAPYISNLTRIQSLDLSNNSLTGPVPDFLSKLPLLRVLKLEDNKLTGSIPVELIEKSKNGSLLLSVDPNLCSSTSCKKKNSTVVIAVSASVAGLFILLLTAAAISWILKKRKRQGIPKVDAESNNQNRSLKSEKRQFTYSDILKITNNFVRILGKGGFGTVYHGYIDDSQVAVKMLSPSSVQGYQQFQAEVQLLMRVHHRNLTTLVGYCYEGTSMGLIYEYMANGNLGEHLSDSKPIILNLDDRLRIAMEAAQGLEYLHNGCKPPIIHRDVKSTNILLNENFQAKLADFGLSKIFPSTDGGSHVSTVVVGTPGYLDPEYSTSNRLTEKSDVYSFGVVLLEIITSRPLMARDLNYEKTHICKWVSFMLGKGDIKNIVDPRLLGDFDSNSAWKAVEIAMACVSQTSARRPSMSQVATGLKECLAIARTKEGHESEIQMISVNLTGNYVTPLAR